MEMTRSPVDALIATLDGLQHTLEKLADHHYCESSSSVFNSPIGAHVRHSLDHIHILVEAVTSSKTTECPVVYYDRRIRDTELQSNRHMALDAIAQIRPRLQALTPEKLQQTIRIEHMMNGAGDCYLFESNLARELFFVTHHAIHHNAIIGACLKEAGYSIDENFGIAPSTLEFQGRQ